MSDEFIPYEQALALEELGFNQRCLAYYYKDDNSKSCYHAELHTIVQPISSNDCVFTPLYQQVFKWFREKYKLWGNIGMQGNNYYTLMVYKTLPECNLIYNNKGYETYEEAELECLKKLIEIVKQ